LPFASTPSRGTCRTAGRRPACAQSSDEGNNASSCAGLLVIITFQNVLSSRLKPLLCSQEQHVSHTGRTVALLGDDELGEPTKMFPVRVFGATLGPVNEHHDVGILLHARPLCRVSQPGHGHARSVNLAKPVACECRTSRCRTWTRRSIGHRSPWPSGSPKHRRVCSPSLPLLCLNADIRPPWVCGVSRVCFTSLLCNSFSIRFLVRR
jgi:hypothetical protein